MSKNLWRFCDIFWDVEAAQNFTPDVLIGRTLATTQNNLRISEFKSPTALGQNLEVDAIINCRKFDMKEGRGVRHKSMNGRAGKQISGHFTYSKMIVTNHRVLTLRNIPSIHVTLGRFVRLFEVFYDPKVKL